MSVKPVTLHTAWIMGKTVKRVDCSKFKPREHHDATIVTVIDRIHFTDGSCVYFTAHEGDHEPYVTAGYLRPESPGESDVS